jgi:enoyl-CoA hydratase/carnithine racemase
MDPPYRHVLVSRDADLGIVTMNRPEWRNALSEAHMLELTQVLRAEAREAMHAFLERRRADSARR